ncbi:MAG: radical SAM family heme chaperone HemW [Nitrospinae bacterium]|nr:radical SAM family heme chaperone HemW [Nitrospinota bacterium]
MSNNTLGIYIHVPYCISKCNYCSFYSITEGTFFFTNYIEQVKSDFITEIHELNKSYTSATFYIGGGTPSNIPSNELSCLIEFLQTYLIQRNIEIIEVTIEVNPADYSIEDFQRLKKSGVTKISLGIQSFDNDELTILGRRHNSQEAFIAVEQALQCDFTCVSVDLMYGIPRQTPTSFSETLKNSFSLGINHLSIYELTLEEGTSFYDNKIAKYDEEKAINLYQQMLLLTSKHGFKRYEISNYAKGEEYKSIHNLNYWKQNDYIGIGPSAVSTVGNRRATHQSSLKSYLKGERSKSIEELTPQQLLFEAIMLSLRTTTGTEKVLLEEYRQKYMSISESKESTINQELFREKGLLQENKSMIFLSNEGFLLYNEIIPKLI